MVETLIVKKGEIIYAKNKDDWEKKYLGKIIAIEVDSGELAGVGETIEEAYKEATKKYPGKPFYFRRVGPCAATDYLFFMLNYKKNLPIAEIVVKGQVESKSYEAYVDTGAARSLIPESDAIKMHLAYIGDITIITGSGKDVSRLYSTKISFLGKEFEVTVMGKDLPEQAPIKAILGRDILDHYKVTFDGKKKKLEIE